MDVHKQAEIELGEFLLELAAKHTLTDDQMCQLLSEELQHTLNLVGG